MKPQSKLTLHDLFLPSPTVGSRVSKLFRFRDEKRSPHEYVFGILELETPRFRALRIADTLISGMESLYDKELGGATIDEPLFEKLVTFFNSKLTLILNQEKIIFNPSSFRIIIAAVSDTDVYIAKYGPVETMLIHRQGEKLQCIDLETKMDTRYDRTRPGKILTQILSGTIGPRDALIFVNKKLATVIPDHDMRELARESGITLIQKLREAYTNHAGRDALALTVVERAPTVIASVAKQSPHIKNKIATSRNAGLAMTNKIESRDAALHDDEKQQKSKAERENSVMIPTFSVLPLINYLARSLKTVVGAILRTSVAIFKLFFIVLRYTREKRNDRFAEWVKRYAYISDPLIEQFNSLRMISKWLFLASIVALFIFIQSSMLVVNQAYKNYLDRTGREHLQTIEDLRTKAEGLIIYGDLVSARAVVASAMTELDTLKPRLKETKERARGLYIALSDMTRKTFKIETAIVKRVIELTKVPTKQNAARTNPRILEYNKTLYAWNSDAMHTIPLQNLEVNLVTPPAYIGEVVLGAPDADHNEILWYSKTQTLAAFDVEKKRWNMLEFDGKESITDLVWYRDALYTLGNAVTKYKRSLTGFGHGETWIRDGSNTSGAKNIAIDGSVYLVYDDGHIEKFFAGVKKNFQMEQFTNAQSRIKRLAAPPDSKFIYLVNAAERTLVVFDRLGQLVLQYELSGKEIHDAHIDEKNKRAFLLGHEALYEIELHHLN